MDYFLVYKDKKNKKRAAIPDIEGLYKRSILFSEYKKPLKKNEIIILASKDLYGENGVLNSKVKNLSAEVVGKFISSSDVDKCIDKIGFEVFFTTVIKQYLKSEN
jgi:hypothetical protein